MNLLLASNERGDYAILIFALILLIVAGILIFSMEKDG